MATTPRFERTPLSSDDGGENPVRRAASKYDTRETTPGFMTSEFISSMVAALAILIAAAVSDNFQADEAWPLVAFLSIGYMISRGLSKAGVARGSSDR